MRSHLVISVEHLPTINEEGPCNDVHLSNRLEEYVKSIQTLAQPSSLTEDLMKQGQARSSKNWHKPRSLFMGCKGHVLNPPLDNATSPTNLNTAEATAVPLAWLYRTSGMENQDSQEAHASTRLTLQQNQQSNTFHIFKTCQHQSSKYQCSEKQTQQRRKSRSQRLQKKCRFTGYNCRGALNILQKPQLPIIYEF